MAGPLSSVLAYLITGFSLYAVINSMGEMATWLPLPGAVHVYVGRYVDPALGFTLGWNHWYQFAIGVPIELSATTLVIDYWPFQTYLAWFSCLFSLGTAFFNEFDCFFSRKFSAKSFIPAYIDIPIVAALFLGYNLYHRTKLIKIEEMDFFSGKEKADRLEDTWEEVKPRNMLG